MQRRFVITGMGGAGKSEACLKFAEENRNSFWGIFWIDVSSETTAIRDFKTVAAICGAQEKSLEGAKYWLENTEHSWLLIIDNADDTSVDYSSYFPTGRRGSLLVTSRNSSCRIHSTVGWVNFEKLEEEDAVTLLLKAAEIPGEQWESRRCIANKVAKLLGHHVLAIVQAGAFIRNHLCDLEEYPERFNHERHSLLTYHSEQASSVYGDVYATFEVSASKMESSSEQRAADALELLKTFAFLHFDAIPEMMLCRAWNHAQDITRRNMHNEEGEAHIDSLSSWHVAHLPSLMRLGRSGTLDLFSLRSAINLLVSFSLVTFSKENTVTMHPLVHAWAKDRIEKKEQEAAWLSTGSLLALSVGRIAVRAVYWQYDAFWPRMQHHISFWLDLQVTQLEEALYSVQMLFYFCWVCILTSDSHTAEFIVKFLSENRASVELNGENYLKRLFLEGVVNEASRDYQEAAAKLEEVVRIRNITLAPDHPIRLSSEQMLASAYQGLEQYTRAAEILEEVVRIEKTTLKAEHPDRLASEHELASAYQGLGQYTRAAEILEEVVRIEKTTLKAEHPDRLASEHELARAYQGLGQYTRAADILEEVVRIRKTTLSAEHSDRLASEHVLARAYQGLGQYTRAAEILEKVVGIRKTTLEAEHPNRLASEHELARAYQGLGQYTRAAEILEEVVRIQKTTLKAEHPDRLASEHVLARAYQGLEQYTRAAEILEEVIRIQKTTLMAEHPNRLASEHVLARAYQGLGQYTRAAEILEEVVRIQKTTLKAEHPDRLASEHVLASAYQGLGQYTRAADILEEVVKIEEKILKAEDSSRLVSRHLLGTIYQELGQYDKATEMLEEIT